MCVWVWFVVLFPEPDPRASGVQSPQWNSSNAERRQRTLVPAQQVRITWQSHDPHSILFNNRDNLTATNELNDFISHRLMEHIKQPRIPPNLASMVQPEIQLLTASVTMQDSCWEHRLRTGLVQLQYLVLYTDHTSLNELFKWVWFKC